MTPADRLRAAATRLREVAGAATPGPWGWHEYGRSGRTLSTPGPVIGGCSTHELNVLKTTDDWPPTDDDARFIATMHPGVALALADLLDSLAFDREVNCEVDGRTWADALALADDVLGGGER